MSLKTCTSHCHLCESSLCGRSVHTHGYLQCSALLNPCSSGGTKNKDQEYSCRANDNLCWHDFQKAMIIRFPAYLHMFIASPKPWNFGWLLISISPQGDIITWATYKTIPWSRLEVQGRDRVNSKAQRQLGGWGEISVIFVLLPVLLHDFYQNHPNPVEQTQWEISSPSSTASLSSPKKARPQVVSWGKLRLSLIRPVCLRLPWCKSSSGSFMQTAIIICTFLRLMSVPSLVGMGMTTVQLGGNRPCI